MKFVFRADASETMGTGHLMRCLALGQAIREAGNDCGFIARSDSGTIVERIRCEGFPVHELGNGNDPAETLSLLRTERPEWVVLDGYHFGAMQRAIVGAGYRLMVLDDTAHLE